MNVTATYPATEPGGLWCTDRVKTLCATYLLRPGSPAEQAGVQAGDVLTGIVSSDAQRRIDNLEDMAFTDHVVERADAVHAMSDS